MTPTYELWQGDMMVARVEGPGAWEEILHYAFQYACDGEVTIRGVNENSPVVMPGRENR